MPSSRELDVLGKYHDSGCHSIEAVEGVQGRRCALVVLAQETAQPCCQGMVPELTTDVCGYASRFVNRNPVRLLVDDSWYISG